MLFACLAFLKFKNALFASRIVLQHRLNALNVWVVTPWSSQIMNVCFVAILIAYLAAKHRLSASTANLITRKTQFLWLLRVLLAIQRASTAISLTFLIVRLATPPIIENLLVGHVAAYQGTIKTWLLIEFVFFVIHRLRVAINALRTLVQSRYNVHSVSMVSLWLLITLALLALLWTAYHAIPTIFNAIFAMSLADISLTQIQNYVSSVHFQIVWNVLTPHTAKTVTLPTFTK